MLKKKEYSLTSQAVYVFLGKFIQFLFQIIVPVILVRLFTTEQYGLYRQVIFMCLLIVPILRFHFTNSLFYLYPNKNNHEEQSELISQTFFILICVGIFFCLIVFIFHKSFISLINTENFNKMVVPAVFLITLYVFSSIVENIFIIEKKSKLVISFLSIDTFIRTLFLLAFVFFYRTIYAALIALVIHGVLKFIFLVIYLLHYYKLNIFKIHLGGVKEQLKYVIPMGLSTVIGTIGKNVDKIILIYLLTSQDFALYSVGNLSIPFIAILYLSVGNVILPQISRFSKKKENNKTIQLWKKMIIKNATFTIPTLIFFFVQANHVFIILFTEKYLASVGVFRIYILVLLIQMLGYGYILRGYGKTKSVFYANLIKTLFSIVFGFLFIKYFGIIGAAVTYVIAFSINGIFQLFRTKCMLNISWLNLLPWMDILKLFLVSLPPIILIILINQCNYSDIVLIIITGIVYFSIVFMAFVKLGYLNIRNIKDLAKLN